MDCSDVSSAKPKLGKRPPAQVATELVIQYAWGKTRIGIILEIQFSLILKPIMLTIGSKDENKFVIN